MYRGLHSLYQIKFLSFVLTTQACRIFLLRTLYITFYRSNWNREAAFVIIFIIFVICFWDIKGLVTGTVNSHDIFVRNLSEYECQIEFKCAL